MSGLGKAFDTLSKKKLTDAAVKEYVSMLLPVADDASETAEKNVLRQREDIMMRYKYAPDLKDIQGSGYRFINAVSDFATHSRPLRETRNYRETLFNKTLEGNPGQYR